MIKLIYGLAAATLLMTLNASAVEYYAGGQIGAVLPQKSKYPYGENFGIPGFKKVVVASVDFKTGMNGALVFGVKENIFRGEAEFGFQQTSIDKVNFQIDPLTVTEAAVLVISGFPGAVNGEVPSVNIPVTGGVGIFKAMFNAMVDIEIPNVKQVIPYLGAGAGIGNARVKLTSFQNPTATIGAITNPIPLDADLFTNGSFTTFLYQFIGGVKVPCNEMFSFTLDYKYMRSLRFGKAYKIKMATHNINGGIIIKLG